MQPWPKGRAERGDWPENLQALATGLDYSPPEDPFADAQYHYERQQDGFVAWSLGGDLDDDGGHSEDDPGYDEDNCDIAWRVTR